MQTNSLRAAIVASCIVFVAFAVRLLFVYFELRELFQPLVAAFLVVVVIGLWLLRPWAIAAARWCWGAILVLTVFGCLVNPVFWHEFPANAEPFGLALPAFYLVISCIGIACWRAFGPNVVRT
jgi:hypothetical protein